jgi:hypothetical protein
MQNPLYLLALCAAVSSFPACAAGTNDVFRPKSAFGFSIFLNEGAQGIKTNQPVRIMVHFNNLSSDTHHIQFPPVIRFSVTSPSGKALLQETNRPESFGWYDRGVAVQPHSFYEVGYLLSDDCKFEELGTYKIVAKWRQVRTAPWISSDPLNVLVVPGEWRSTNAPEGF